MAPKKATTTSGKTGSCGNDDCGGKRVSDAPGGDNTNPPDLETTIETTETATEFVHTPVIAMIISLCDFSEDSTIAKFINQQGWTKLFHITTIGVDGVKDFYTTRRDGNFEAKPMMIHIRIFKCFLLYYKRKCRALSTILDEDDVLNIT